MAKKLKATHEGILPIGNTELNVAVLEDGTRIITQSAVFKAFGRTKRGRALHEKRVPNMPAFIDANNLQPFIGNDLKEVLKQIDYVEKNGKTQSSGYNALILPKLCKVYLNARQEKVLKPQQLPLARASEILLFGLSNIGIIALVDEATGYQYDREEKELQTILKILVSDEILEYQKQFQISFYKEIFRLWEIPFTPHNIKRKPRFIGHLTNKFVYQNLPKGIFVLDKLKEKTPRTIGGNYKYRLHQSLTKEAGIEALKKVLYSVEALASVSRDKREFERLIEEKYGQKEIPFTDLEEIIKEDEDAELSDFNKKLKKALDYNSK